MGKQVELGKECQAQDIVDILNKEKGEEFKANFTGAWDKYNVVKASIANISRGKGFEESVKVAGITGEFIYMPPFKIESLPNKDEMFLFYADDGIYIK